MQAFLRYSFPSNKVLLKTMLTVVGWLMAPTNTKTIIPRDYSYLTMLCATESIFKSKSRDYLIIIVDDDRRRARVAPRGAHRATLVVFSSSL